MPRRQKPPGYEKWTWDEIHAGRRMSKAEKRTRRMAMHLGASKGEDGRIEPPAFSDNPGYWIFFIVMLIFCVGIAILSEMK